MIKNPLTCLDRYDPSWALAPVWEGDTPVSYTHLDVHKRQMECWPPTR